MANINDITEPWNGHSGIEVETWVKSMLATIGVKFGYVQFTGASLVFYDVEGGQVLQTVDLTGDVFNITIDCNLPQSFYVLADETSKVMTFSPSTTRGSIGSSQVEPFPESYTYAIAVNNGSGYVTRDSGTIPNGGSVSFDVINYLSSGDNFVRITVTGDESGQVRSSIFTAVLTSLTMNINHPWQNVWNQGAPYNITGIRFAGSIVKTLHVRVNGTELDPVTYPANVSYTTTSTYYSIPAEAFPATAASGVYAVDLWMTAAGVSTPVTTYNIMCLKENSTTPLVCINAIAPSAVNYTSARLFSYAIINANKVSIDLSATLGASTYTIATAIPQTGLEVGIQYPFAYALEVDTGANEVALGSLAMAASAFMDSTAGYVATGSMLFDNTYSYIATSGALFYLNAATRDNGRSDYQTIINEMGAQPNFPATYSATWSGMSWKTDGWSTDPNGYKALCIQAGSSCVFNGFNPLSLLTSYRDGMTIEMMIQSSNPSDYDHPVITMSSGGDRPLGIIVYPTKITVWGQSERDEDYQTINLSENKMTHICITFTKGYEGLSGKNLCSVYINGTSNVCFAFSGSSSFGDGNFTIGQAETDTYLYKMRVYGTALEPGAVFNNFLNCIFDGLEFVRRDVASKNNILDGDYVDYEKVKAAGYNTMVVITPNNEAVPDFYNQVTVDNTVVRFEYAGTPAKNVTVGNVSMDGQGTTSKKYYRWNLRWKTSDDTYWNYGDGTNATGKTGKVINDDAYIAVDRITAKKNIASSPQGHKMGLTGLYNDLFHAIPRVVAGLPSSSYRTAVYQFPFIGFRYNNVNGTYEYLGQFTAGPDKGSKVTFGYIKGTYPDCLSIEGPNHAPRGTRFVCPWVDVTYSPADETLMFGGQEGWDADYVKWETSTKGTQTDWDNILNLYIDEWKPAYDCVYNNSPYIASVAEVIAGVNDPSIQTLADILNPSNAVTVKDAFTAGMIVSNEDIAFYDTNYDLYYFRRSSGHFERLSDAYDIASECNILTAFPLATRTEYCANPAAPTSAEIRAMRGARFKATAPNYFDMDQTLFHYIFCILFGVTDNFAKNSYPQKYTRLSSVSAGNRWGWRQDDLDSVLQTDNNGTNTKKYSVEHLDTADGVQIFQGGESALWLLIHNYYESEQREMMGLIANAAAALATSLGIAGSGLHGSMFNLTSYYCWEKSAKYFPITAYEKDRRYAYIEPWLLAGQLNPSSGELFPATYNGVPPLTQAVGDQYQGERLWMERRIAYIFSKYRIGPFTGDNSGYNAINFTLAESFTFSLTPAIDLYPVVSLANAGDSQGGRTPAGTPVNVSIGAQGGTNNYIHGGDWLASLGDLHSMRLTTRGTSTSIDFSVTGMRLRTLQVGHATDTIRFNATNFGATSPTLTSIDARNVETITNTVNLLGCPRLRTCYFEGCTQANGLYLPVGAKLTEVSFPDNAKVVFMHSITTLAAANLTLPALGGIESLYINRCANINAVELLGDIVETVNNALEYVTAIWDGIVNGNMDTILAMKDLAGYVSFDNNSVDNFSGRPYLEGTVQVPGLHQGDLESLDIVSEETYQQTLKKALTNYFNSNLYIIYDPNTIYISFVDPEVERICVANWSSDGVGLTVAEAAAVTNNQLGNTFQNNTDISAFDELRYFTGITQLKASAFNGASSLTRVTIPSSISVFNVGSEFRACSSLAEFTINGATTFNAAYAFNGDTALKRLNVPSIDVWMACYLSGHNDTYARGPFDASKDGHVYINGSEVTALTIPNTVTSIGVGVCRWCKGITSVSIPSTVTSIGTEAFRGCTGLTSFTIPSTVTSLGTGITMLNENLVDLICNSTTTVSSGTFWSAGGTQYGSGNGTGTFYCAGDFSNGGNYFSSFRKYVFGGNYTNTGGGGGTLRCGIINNHFSCEIVKIKGNFTTNGSSAQNSGPIQSPGNNANYGRLAFLEIMGTITSSYTMYRDSSVDVIDGYILHLGYDVVANNAFPCTPDIAGASFTRLAKIYVGDGSSASHDNAILAQYLADTDWSAYSSKLDTWYNYINSPDANQDFIN